MLIPFPFAFLTGAFLFDCVALWTGNMDLAYTGRYLTLVGIAAGLVAAVPGIIDYASVVPPNSSGKTRATRHALANVSALAVFAVSYVLRTDGEASIPTLAAQGVGLALLAAGGYMGGTLVYRNQIGVDHRYANAGKWREISIGTTGTPIMESRELQRDQMVLVNAGGRRVALGRSEKGYAAFDDRCTHRGGPLADGVLICGTVQCPWHGSQFDVHSGEVKCGPAKQKIAAYTVDESDGQVRLRL